MAVFRIVSSRVPSTGFHPQRLMSVRRRWYAAIQRFGLILLVVIPLSILLFAAGLSVWFFILLPLFTGILWDRSKNPQSARVATAV